MSDSDPENGHEGDQPFDVSSSSSSSDDEQLETLACAAKKGGKPFSFLFF